MFHRHLEIFRNDEDEIVVRQFDEKGELNYVRIPVDQANSAMRAIGIIIDEISAEDEE